MLRIALDLDPKYFGNKFRHMIIKEELENYLQQILSNFIFKDFLYDHFEESIKYLIPKLNKGQTSYRLKSLHLIEDIFLHNNPPREKWKDIYRELVTVIRFSPLPVVPRSFCVCF